MLVVSFDASDTRYNSVSYDTSQVRARARVSIRAEAGWLQSEAALAALLMLVFFFKLKP
jgi:hypothetical protein